MVFAEAKVAFTDADLGGGRHTADQSPRASSVSVKIRILASEKVFEIICTPEKSVLKTVLEAVTECF